MGVLVWEEIYFVFFLFLPYLVEAAQNRDPTEQIEDGVKLIFGLRTPGFSLLCRAMAGRRLSP